ncbi:MAG: cation transporter [Gemmatimonadota bacterium]
MERATIEIGGMSCGHCVGAVTRVLQGLEGVSVEEVKIGSATVEYDPQAVTPERIGQAIGEEGYEAHVAGSQG